MLHISKDEQRERLQERIDDPAKHWKFELRRSRGAQAVGRLPARLRRRASRATGTPLGAVDVVPGRLQDAPQPDDRHRAARHAEAACGCGTRPKTRPSRG